MAGQNHKDLAFRADSSSPMILLKELQNRIFGEKSNPAQPTTSTPEPTNSEPVKWIFAFIAAIAIVGIPYILGNFHFITGKLVGLKMVDRESFGFSEIFINMDEVVGMPWISAKSLYPIAVRVLQREHLIETDEQHMGRHDNP